MAEPPPVLTLLVEKGPRKGQSAQQRAGAVLRVGRVVKGNHLAVGDAGASQRHLDIAFLPPPASRWAATDLGSSNGTLLNGAPLVPTIPSPLSHGDCIKIGESTVLAVSIAADADPEPAATRRSARHAAASAAAVEEEENKAPAVRRGRRKAPAAADPLEAVKEVAEVAPCRGGRKKAPAPVDPLEEEKEEAAPPVTRRGGRRKAVQRPEAESEEEEVLPGGPSKAPVTDALPPQPQTTRSTRAAARRAEPVGTVQGKGEGEKTRGDRGRATRQSARKAKETIDDVEKEGEVAVPEKQEGTTAKSARLKNDKVENGDGTSNESELQVPVALREPAERTRKGRGRARARTRKAKDPVIEDDAEKDGEDGDVVGARECSGNPPQVAAATDGDEKVDEGTIGSEEVDGALKVDLAPREQTQSVDGRADTHGDSADKDAEGKKSGRKEGIVPESNSDGVGEANEDGKRGVSAGRGDEGGSKNVNKCPDGCNLKNMTLREWFVQIEKYILEKNHEAAEKAIAELEEKHQRFIEYIKTLK